MTENNFNKFRLTLKDCPLHRMAWVSTDHLKQHFPTMRKYVDVRYEPKVIHLVLQHFFDAGFLIDVDFSFYRELQPTLMMQRIDDDPQTVNGVNVRLCYLIRFESNDGGRFDDFCATIALLPLKFDVQIEELKT